MKTLSRVCVIAAALAVASVTIVHAQVRGIAGAGLSFPIGDFADENGGGAQSGGGNVLVGVEWLPTGRNFGLRADGNYTQFCTTFCDEIGGDLDVKYQVLNANLSGILDLPIGTAGNVHPYLLAGAGIYRHRLHGDDVSSAADDAVTDFGLSAGLGLNVQVGRIGLFAEGRFHDVLADGDDLQYVPVTLGVRLGGQ
jgi:hypothetical protein